MPGRQAHEILAPPLIITAPPSPCGCLLPRIPSDTKEGLTPLELALKKRHRDIAQTLRRARWLRPLQARAGRMVRGRGCVRSVLR